MSEHKVLQAVAAPAIQKIGFADIARSLNAGWADFVRASPFGLFFGGIFTVGGLFIWWILSQTNQTWMVIPVMIGFPLIGPFAATGLYEISRKLEAGEPLTWRGVLLTVFSQRERQMGWMAFVVLFAFWIWIYQIRLLIALFLGFNTPATLQGFADIVLNTQSGFMFLAVGTIMGAVLALLLFTICVVSMPLLLEREIDFVTAIITSFEAVIANPIPMLSWGVVVTLLSILAMVPAFLGLLVVFPVLGHATWHLYKAVTDQN